MKRCNLIFLTVILLVAACGRDGQSDITNPPTYDLTVQIIPKTHFIGVKGRLQVPSDAVSDTLSLYIHRQFVVNSFTLNGNAAFETDSSASAIRYLPEARRIFFVAGNHSSRDAIVEFSYSGHITENPEWLANVISDDWTEIGLYLPWFPYNPDIEPFMYNLRVQADTALRLAAMGEMKVAGRFRIFQTRKPTNDIVLCAARDLRLNPVQIGENRFMLASYSLGRQVSDSLLGDIRVMYGLFGTWFGKRDGEMLMVESKRKSGGAYGRLGGLFLPGFEEAPYLDYRSGYRRYLGHELAHNWWHHAPATQWHDWLNESFAEYSALMLLRQTDGPGIYAKYLQKYRAGIDTLPPVWNLNRDDAAASGVLYRKGPVLLSELEQRIGTTEFSRLLSALVHNEVSRTGAFLEILQKQQGAETALWFENQLKSR